MITAPAHKTAIEIAAGLRLAKDGLSAAFDQLAAAGGNTNGLANDFETVYALLVKYEAPDMILATQVAVDAALAEIHA